jgi:hypothetical protein
MAHCAKLPSHRLSQATDILQLAHPRSYPAPQCLFDIFCSLRVPGLAEKCPDVSPTATTETIDSVQQGDSILVQEQNTNSDQWFEGHVHSIRKTEVGLRFHASFHKINGSTSTSN